MTPEEKEVGLGPDAAITMRLQARYAADDVVTGRDLQVDTQDGVVRLRGRVDSGLEKERAEQIATGVEGVKQVVNELRVAAPR